MDAACFNLCSEDSGDEIFLTQVVREESQKLLNQTMTMDDNFDVNLFQDSDTEDTFDQPEADQFCSNLAEL